MGGRRGIFLFGIDAMPAPILIPKKPLVVLLGFNNTMVLNNLHNQLCLALQDGSIPRIPNGVGTASETKNTLISEQDCWMYLKNFIKPIDTPENWQTLLTWILKHEGKIAILSFTQFPFIIERFLREILRLPEEVMKKIFICSRCPQNPDSTDKTDYIKAALNHFNLTCASASVVFIDAFEKNLQAAKEQGCVKTILSREDGWHLQQLQQAFFELAVPTRERQQDAFLDYRPSRPST